MGDGVTKYKPMPGYNAIAAALRGRWGEHGEKLAELLSDVAEGRYIPKRDLLGEVVEEDGLDLSRFPSVQLQVGVAKYLLERMVGKVPDVVVTAELPVDTHHDLTELPGDELVTLRRILSTTMRTSKETERVLEASVETTYPR